MRLNLIPWENMKIDFNEVLLDIKDDRSMIAALWVIVKDQTTKIKTLESKI